MWRGESPFRSRWYDVSNLTYVHTSTSRVSHVVPMCCVFSHCRHFPGELQRIMEWFRDYKIPDGKPANLFGWDGICQSKAFAIEVIKETHQAYVALKSGLRVNSEELSLI